MERRRGTSSRRTNEQNIKRDSKPRTLTNHPTLRTTIVADCHPRIGLLDDTTLILDGSTVSFMTSLRNAIHESITDTFLKTKKPNRLAYKILVSKKQKRPITAQTKWIADCTLETQEIIDWKTVYRTPFLCTKMTKIIVFQFKLLHRRLATNSFLTKINLKDNEQCTFCQNDKETLIHLFWTCEISTLFWAGFKQWAINRGELSNNTNLSPYLVLGLKPNKNKSINFYFLIARYFIWICKMRSLSPKIENFSLFLSHYDITKTFS